jgi:hypothetical protein
MTALFWTSESILTQKRMQNVDKISIDLKRYIYILQYYLCVYSQVLP